MSWFSYQKRLSIVLFGAVFVTVLSGCKNGTRLNEASESRKPKLEEQFPLAAQIPKSSSIAVAWKGKSIPGWSYSFPSAREMVFVADKDTASTLDAWCKTGLALLELKSQSIASGILAEADDSTIEGESYTRFLSSREGEQRLSALKAPSLLFAAHLPDTSEREKLFNEINLALTELGKRTKAEVIQTPITGGILKGIKINFLTAYLSINNQKEETLLASLGEQRSKRLIESLKKQSFVVFTGNIEDKFILQCSPTSQPIEFAERYEDSILSSPNFDTLRKKAGNAPKLFFFASQDSLGEIAKNFQPLSAIAKGVRRATSAADSSPLRQRLERALDQLADREAALVERYFMRDAVGYIVPEQNGYSFEMTGGPDLPFLNLADSSKKQLPQLDRIYQKGGVSLQAEIDPEGIWHLTSLANSLTQCLLLSGKDTPILPWSSWASQFSQEPDFKKIDEHTFALLNCLSRNLALSFKHTKDSNKNIQGWFLADIANASLIQSHGPQWLSNVAELFKVTYPALGQLIPRGSMTSSSEGTFLHWTSSNEKEGNAALSADKLILGTANASSKSLIPKINPDKAESALLKFSTPINDPFHIEKKPSFLTLNISTSGPSMLWQGFIQPLSTYEN